MDGYTPEYNVTPKPETPKYGIAHSLIAVFCFIAGYLFIKWFVASEAGLTSFVFAFVFTAFSCTLMATRLVKKRIKPRAVPVFMLASYFIISFFFLITPDSPLSSAVKMFYVISYPLWYHLTFSKETEVGDTVLFDAVKSVFVLPFCSFASVFPALFFPIRNGKHGKKLGYIIIGILIAVIPSATVILLLASADAAFGNLIDNIISFVLGNDLIEVTANMMIFFVSIPVSMYLFGMVYSSTEKRCTDIFPDAYCENTQRKLGFLPTLITASAVIPLCIIYILFFVSQLGYYLSAFGSLVPEGYTAARYARSGFFQLAAVAAINLIAIISASVFTKKPDGKGNRTIKILNVVLSSFTLILIATAIRKMVLYIDLFGFTRLRIITTLFMLFLGAVFIFVIIRQFKRGFNTVASSIITAAVMASVLCTVNIDARVVQFNVSLYRNGKISECDINSFYGLSLSAAEYAVPLLDSDDSGISETAEDYLKYSLSRIRETLENAKYRTPALVRAEKILSEAIGDTDTK